MLISQVLYSYYIINSALHSLFLIMNDEETLYLLITESHLPPRISRDIHAAQKDSLLVTIVYDVGGGLRLEAPHQLALD